MTQKTQSLVLGLLLISSFSQAQAPAASVAPSPSPSPTASASPSPAASVSPALSPSPSTAPLLPEPTGAQIEAFMRSTFVSGKGLGGLEIGMPASKIEEVLGRAKSVTKRSVGDSHRYGLLGQEIEVISAPSGPAGVIKGIYVNTNYQGATDKGIHVRDSMKVVQDKMGETKVLVSTEKELLYDDGMYFTFQDTPPELVRIGVADRKDPSFEKLRSKK